MSQMLTSVCFLNVNVFKHVIINCLAFYHFLYLKREPADHTSSAGVQCDMGFYLENGHFSSVPAQGCSLGCILYLPFIRCVQHWQLCRGQGAAAHVVFLPGGGYT